MSMVEYDLLISYLRIILKDSLYCEDNELHIKNKCKYELYNLMKEVDKDWLDEVLKELEYID